VSLDPALTRLGNGRLNPTGPTSNAAPWRVR